MGPPAAGAPGDNRSDGSTTVKDDKESKANRLHEWELYRLHEWELYRLHEWELFLVGVEHFHRQQALKRKQAKKIAYKQAKEEERACKKQQTAQKNEATYSEYPETPKDLWKARKKGNMPMRVHVTGFVETAEAAEAESSDDENALWRYQFG